jgi:hypothetical protein
MRSARPEERAKWLGFVRTFLALVLGSVPQIDDPRQQEIDGLPDQFDNWVFGLVASSVPSLTATEDPRSLWQPILDLGSPAHQWVERFFWDWFTDGLRAAPSPQEFTRLWTDMIEHALASPSWDPSVNRTYGLDGMVFQLLGFDTRMNKLGQNPAFALAVTAMEGVFARAAQQWFSMPKVVTGFLNFATQPALGGLMLPGSGGWRQPCPRLIPTTGNMASKKISLRSCIRAGSASIAELPATRSYKGPSSLCWRASSPAEGTRLSRFVIASSIPPPVKPEASWALERILPTLL